MKNVKTIAQTKKVTLNKIVISSFTKSQTTGKNGLNVPSNHDTRTSADCYPTITA